MPRNERQEDRAHRLYEAGKKLYAAHFDAKRELVRLPDAEGEFFSPRWSLAYARCLLLDGREAERDLAVRIIEHVLAVQERQPGNIHEGNWPWMVDDGYVYDLNSVSFVIEELCALMRDSQDKLPEATKAAIREAMHLGLSEHARLDVAITYTNIFLLDLHNTILGGQILNAPAWIERGTRNLERWIAYTGASGAPSEFLSPTYTPFGIISLALVAEHASDPRTRLLARVGEERMWLHVATHYHGPTAQLAGPHCRAYQNDVTGGRNYSKFVLYQVLGDEQLMRKTPYYGPRQVDGNVDVGRTVFHCPEAIRQILAQKPWPFAVRETAVGQTPIDISSELTADWAVGACSSNYGPQSDSVILHYRKDTEPGYGVAYCRFILNDKRVGTHYQANTRSHTSNLNEEGTFRGLHHRNKVIGVYGLNLQGGDVSSIRLDFFFAGRALLEHVYIGDRLIDPKSLPVEVAPGVPVVVEDGGVFVSILPLRHSNLGREAPIRVEARDTDLVLSTVIYEGPAKLFWQYSSPRNSFYHGNIESGFVLEVAARSEFPDAGAFVKYLAAARLEDVTADGVRKIRYRSGGDDLLLRYQLSNMDIVERRVNDAPFVPVPLDSPIAVQRPDGPLELPGCRLVAPPRARWLYTNPAGDIVTATRADPEPGPWELRLPGHRTIAAESLGLARITCAWKDSRVDIEAADPCGSLTLRGWPQCPALTVNGRDCSPDLVPGFPNEWSLLL